MASNYLEFSQAASKISSWPNRKDVRPNPWLMALGITAAVLIVVFPPAGLAALAGGVIGASISAAALGVVGWPLVKVVAKLTAKLVVTPIAFALDVAIAPFKALKDGFSFIANRISRRRAVDKSPQEIELAPAAGVDLDEPDVQPAVPGVQKKDSAPAIASDLAFEAYLAVLKNDVSIAPRLKENSDEKDPNKIVSVSIELDTSSLIDKAARSFTVEQVEGKTVFKLDSPQAAMDPEDRKKLLEQMCKTAIDHELPGYTFQVDPSAGTAAERAELNAILTAVRAEKAALAQRAAGVEAQLAAMSPADAALARPGAAALLASTPAGVVPVVEPASEPLFSVSNAQPSLDSKASPEQPHIEVAQEERQEQAEEAQQNQAVQAEEEAQEEQEEIEEEIEAQEEEQEAVLEEEVAEEVVVEAEPIKSSVEFYREEKERLQAQFNAQYSELDEKRAELAYFKKNPLDSSSPLYEILQRNREIKNLNTYIQRAEMIQQHIKDYDARLNDAIAQQAGLSAQVDPKPAQPEEKPQVIASKIHPDAPRPQRVSEEVVQAELTLSLDKRSTDSLNQELAELQAKKNVMTAQNFFEQSIYPIQEEIFFAEMRGTPTKELKINLAKAQKDIQALREQEARIDKINGELISRKAGFSLSPSTDVARLDELRSLIREPNNLNARIQEQQKKTEADSKKRFNTAVKEQNQKDLDALLKEKIVNDARILEIAALEKVIAQQPKAGLSPEAPKMVLTQEEQLEIKAATVVLAEQDKEAEQAVANVQSAQIQANIDRQDDEIKKTKAEQEQGAASTPVTATGGGSAVATASTAEEAQRKAEELAAKEKEEKEKAEKERLEAERLEKEREEAERAAAEAEIQAAEKQRLEKEEAERLEKERLEQEEARRAKEKEEAQTALAKLQEELTIAQQALEEAPDDENKKSAVFSLQTAIKDLQSKLESNIEATPTPEQAQQPQAPVAEGGGQPEAEKEAVVEQPKAPLSPPPKRQQNTPPRMAPRPQAVAAPPMPEREPGSPPAFAPAAPMPSGALASAAVETQSNKVYPEKLEITAADAATATAALASAPKNLGMTTLFTVGQSKAPSLKELAAANAPSVSSDSEPDDPTHRGRNGMRMGS